MRLKTRLYGTLNSASNENVDSVCFSLAFLCSQTTIRTSKGVDNHNADCPEGKCVAAMGARDPFPIPGG